MANDSYDASKITVLEGLEAVRKRPAMYIGGTGINGLHHLVKEIVDNSIDEALAGHANKIEVFLNEDGSVTVTDNGRGIPVDKHKQTGASALETIMTTLHAGGKFDKGSYKVSSGLHGVGSSVVNALSESMVARVHRDGKIYEQKYAFGKKKNEVKSVGTTKLSGTEITFKPDAKIFPDIGFELRQLLSSLRQQAYLIGGLTFEVNDKRKDEKRNAKDEHLPRKYVFHFEDGIKAYIKQLTRNEKTLNTVFYTHGVVDGVDVEIALQYSDDLQERVMAFTNNIHNIEGGTHLTGFRIALTKGINDYFSLIAAEKEKGIKFTGEDTREGLTAVVSVKVGEPQFEGQTKIKLNNPEVTHAVRQVVEEGLKEYLAENPKDAKGIISRVTLTNRARKAAKAARESVIRKGALEGGTLPGKLADCSSRKAETSELFVVEGDSAGGSAKQGRDRSIQAILPLSGKPINSEKYRIDRVMQNDKLKDLVIVLGAGISESFEISKLRYHKIIIMSDADVDGAHITTLILTLFYRHLRPVIENGYLYVAQPPLYKAIVSKDEFYYISDDNELDEIMADLKKRKKTIKQLTRFKGLGEMNPEQLWETTMDPENRVLKQITIEDAEEADKTFDLLMGNEVLPRRKFIQAHAQQAELDI